MPSLIWIHIILSSSDGYKLEVHIIDLTSTQLVVNNINLLCTIICYREGEVYDYSYNSN